MKYKTCNTGEFYGVGFSLPLIIYNTHHFSSIFRSIRMVLISTDFSMC